MGDGTSTPAGPTGPDGPWYENRVALATVIFLGLALLFLLIGWLVWWSSDDDPAVVIDGSTTTTTLQPDDSTLPTASIVDVDPLPTVATTESTTTTTTTTSTTTTTVAPTTTATPATTAAPTTAAPATTSSVPVVSVPTSPGATLLDIIDVSPDLSRLSQLIVDAGLTDELSGEDPLTIFAPSNQAFTVFEASPGAADILADPDALREFLLGHLVAGSLDASQVLASDTLTTVNGQTLVVNPDAVTIDGAAIVVTDVEAANGILHVIDRVIVPG